jgi:hypothetical protein
VSRSAALVTTVAVLALVVRVAGNRFGLPHEYHPDENMLIRVASAMAAGADWNPHFFHWGGGHFYVTSFVFRAASALGVLASEADAYFVARTLTAVMGAATVAITMMIVERAYRNRLITGLTGLVFAFTMLHVRTAHYATVDVPAAFWLMLSVWLFICAVDARRGRLGLFGAAGLVAGMAVGTKYSVGLIVPVLMAGVLAARPERGRAGNVRAALAILAASAAGFLLTNPFAIFDYPSFSAGVRELMTHYDRPDLHPRNHGEHNWLFFLRTLAGGESDPFVMLTGAAGVVFLLKEERRGEVLALMAFPLLTFIYLSSQSANYIRNLIPLMPFLAMASAVGTTRLIGVAPAKTRKLWLAVVAGAVVLWLGRVVQFDRILLRPDTRQLATAWLADHLAPGSKVAMEREYWASPVLPAGAVGSRLVLAENPLAFYRERGFDYIITNSVSYQAYFVYQDRMPGTREAYARLLQDLDEQTKRVIVFTGQSAGLPVNDELPNPEIRIYRLSP